MKRENLIAFLLTLTLAAVSAIFGTVWTINDKVNDNATDTRERLARIETKVENLESTRLAKHP